MSENKDKKNKINMDKMSRRGFLKVGSLAMGGVAMGMVTGCGGTDDVRVHDDIGLDDLINSSSLPKTWDETSDLVFIGYGGAAAMASIHAVKADPSIKIHIIEIQESGGGSTRMSGAGTQLGGGTRLQTDNGFNETPEQFLTSAIGRAGEGGNEAILTAYANNAKEAFETLLETGLTYTGFSDMYLNSPLDADSLIFDGEKRPEYSTDLGIPAVPHVHFPIAEDGASRAQTLWKYLHNAVSALSNVTVSYSTEAKSLYVDGDGRVVGVKTLKNGAEVNFNATKAVLMSNGGFIKNDEMVKQFVPHAINCSRGGNPYDLGSGIKMGQEIGADLQMMNASEDFCPTYYYAPAYVKSIAINPSGMRFAAEDLGGPFMGTWVARTYPLSYLVFDKTIRDEIPAALDAIITGRAVSANTIAELAALINVSPTALQATVDTYNTYANNGVDEQFAKDPATMQPLVTPPFYAQQRVSQEVFTLTNGGLRINDKAQVLKPDGTVIPGFYAAGATTANINAQYYLSGGGTGGAFVFGMIAAKEMVTETSWEG
ncbi:MAG: FAD-binding protein [Deferribacterales bacterium]